MNNKKDDFTKLLNSSTKAELKSMCGDLKRCVDNLKIALLQLSDVSQEDIPKIMLGTLELQPSERLTTGKEIPMKEYEATRNRLMFDLYTILHSDLPVEPKPNTLDTE